MNQRIIAKSERYLKHILSHPEEDSIPYPELRQIVSRYMTADEFLQGFMREVNPSDTDDDYDYNLTSIDKIAEYRIKTSKNGKVKNPWTRATIDFSDILETYGDKQINSFDKKKIRWGKESISIIFHYYGKLCLPFDGCCIFCHVANKLGQVLEITHDLRGNYSGTFFTFLKLGSIIQAKFNIKRENDYWAIEFNLPFKQRPLGRKMTNMGAIILMLSCQDLEYKKAICDGNEDINLEYMVACDIFVGAVCILEAFDSYKSKFVYQLTKGDKKVYLYSDKLDVKEYVEKHYPGFEYTLLDSWIINGYWEFCKGQSGKDKSGKLIPGMNWVTPHETDIEDNVEANGQQSNKVKIHAIERAKERYNLNFTNEDLKYITDECLKTGKLLSVKDAMGRVKTSKSCYRVKYQNTILDVALDYGLDKSVRVATFLPKPKDVNHLIIDSKQYNEIQNDINK